MSQLTYTTEELLTTSAVAEPLVANGVRCHGGIDAEGNYVSPRTKFRTPAIAAWQENHLRLFPDKALIDIGLDDWPTNFPSLEQTQMLLRHEASEPVVTPALDLAAGEQRTTGERARRNRCGITNPCNGHWYIGISRGAIAKLAVLVRSPAFDSTAGQQRTAVAASTGQAGGRDDPGHGHRDARRGLRAIT